MAEQGPHLHAVGSAAAAASHPAEPWNGLTAPQRRGGSGRFLTDVLVELGYTDRDRAQRAVEEATICRRAA